MSYIAKTFAALRAAMPGALDDLRGDMMTQGRNDTYNGAWRALKAAVAVDVAMSLPPAGDTVADLAAHLDDDALAAAGQVASTLRAVIDDPTAALLTPDEERACDLRRAIDGRASVDLPTLISWGNI